MNLSSLQLLFEQITDITKVKDIGLHRIVEGKLVPVYKTQTDELGMERWKTVHGQNPVSVKGTKILEELFETKAPVEIYDNHTDVRAADAFFLFGVDSIMILPLIEHNVIVGIVCVVSIGYLHQFTKDEIKNCKTLVDQYFKNGF